MAREEGTVKTHRLMRAVVICARDWRDYWEQWGEAQGYRLVDYKASPIGLDAGFVEMVFEKPLGDGPEKPLPYE